METPGGAPSRVGAQVGLSVMVALLICRSTGLVCYTAVESLDLGCLLQWDCPSASPNTTYTVQTKTQGDPWQDVAWCVWTSSRTCDVSQAFSNFELYNMIRLGVHLSPVATVWTEPRKFDYSDFTFSPPSVSVSLKDDLRLLVRVQFPCAASRRCSMQRCCPISLMIDPWTTVTMYNTLEPSEHQTRTVWTQEVASDVEFSGLSPGQTYCVEANFSFPTFSMAASPKSAPQCVQTLSKSGLMPGLCLGIGLTSLLLAPLLMAFVKKTRRPARTAENPPKTPAPVHDPVSLVPVSLVPVDPCDIHVEFADDRVSTESSSSLPSNQEQAVTCGEMERGRDSGISIPPVSLSFQTMDQ
ncbi:uncharacterized protein si:dkeyp-75h12.7 [Betta splendens]|uniref:Uncharacterized protein si:dkeyp-75h12.7 n=1 Tax=Betta splendens TaxID=158456 RepID=A0A6P7LY01_BETSP|nr:uncharacterized protein si:dkeyp-75h12.7 [Betta splendens]XP_028999165.1 uncharacterized protein si:dkeyp-75h12.7 [Betta splendens]